jgi:hypothetical protein
VLRQQWAVGSMCESPGKDTVVSKGRRRYHMVVSALLCCGCINRGVL